LPSVRRSLVDCPDIGGDGKDEQNDVDNEQSVISVGLRASTAAATADECLEENALYEENAAQSLELIGHIYLLTHGPCNLCFNLRVTAAHLLQQIDWLLNATDGNTLRKVSLEGEDAEHHRPERTLHEKKNVG